MGYCVRFLDIVSLCSDLVSRLGDSPEGQVCLVVSDLKSISTNVVVGFNFIPKRSLFAFPAEHLDGCLAV
jgi:hypothetical protein